MDSLWSQWSLWRGPRSLLKAEAARACARSCTCPFLGTLFRDTGFMPVAWFVTVIWKALSVSHRSIREYWLDSNHTVGTSKVAQVAAFRMTVMAAASDFWPSNIPDLPVCDLAWPDDLSRLAKIKPVGSSVMD